MKLHLIRHAKAETQSKSGKDIDRKLSSKGIIQANVLSYFLINSNIKPEIIICSSATRTKETCQIIKNVFNSTTIIYSDELYLCEPKTFLKIIDLQSTHGEILIIGHNDGISELVSYFTENDVFIRTSEYYCIEFLIDNWSEASNGNGRVIDFFRPEVALPDH